MRSCLVVTHPSLRYDRAFNVRDEIVRIAGNFAPEDRYILHDNGYASRERCEDYLHGIKAQFVFSRWGELNGYLAKDLLHNCDNFTITGHLFGVCHSDTYRSILADQKKDKIVNVPLRASSVRISGAPASSFVPLVKNPSLDRLRRNHRFVELEMDYAQRCAIAFAACYVDSALSLSSDASIDFQVDGQTVLRSLRKRQKKVVVDFQLAA